MIWLVWRRQRAALLVALGVVVLVAAVLVVGRFATVAAAADAGLSDCLLVRCQTEAWYEFRSGFGTFDALVRLAMLLTPAIAGIAAGTGLFGRELERDTHLFALTQSVGRLRWWAYGLLVAGLPVVVAVTLLAGVRAWEVAPFPTLVDDSPLQVSTFELTGIVPTVYVVLAFSLAATAGLWLRNAMGAIVLAFALQSVVQLGLSFGLREHYIPPVTDRFALSSSGVTVPADARYVDGGFLDASGRELADNPFRSTGCSFSTQEESDACLRAAGITGQYVRYQPASRYWPFQGIETGIVLVLVAGTLAAGVGAVRTRVH